MKVNNIAFTALLSVASALELDITDEASIKSAAFKIVKDLVDSYPLENNLLPSPHYYFWESGIYWNTLLDYTLLTNDTSLFSRSNLTSGLSSQVGEALNFMPMNQTKSMGNDDQSYWALAAMTATEHDPIDGTWLPILENVWNSQAARWDEQNCGGGLRWQIFTFNNGYTYKNSASNMNFFLLSARMAKYTGNSTYADWAGRTFDWSVETGLIGENSEVFDGALTDKNCSEANQIQWSANAATAAYGATIMENLNISSSSDKSSWKERKSGVLTHFLSTFTKSSILAEVACESQGTCNTDGKAFKGITASYLAKIAQLDDSAAVPIAEVLEASAKAAAASCQDDGSCGFVWTDSKFDNDTGAGQQMNALNAITGLLAKSAKLPGIQGSNTQAEGTGTVTGTAPASTGTGADSATSSAATVSQTGAASSFGSVSAGWGVGAVALGFAALL